MKKSIPEQQETHNNRVVWVDIFKGLAILLVVLGHATGLLNQYIYQFHVAAFFFISGWTAKFEKHNLGRTIYNKTIYLLIPLFTAVVLISFLLELLKLFNIFNLFYAQDVGSFFQQLKQFIIRGETVDILGASWFILVLFPTCILTHIVFLISGKKLLVFSIISLTIYIVGYYFVKKSIWLPYNLHLVPIASGYYSAGYIFGRIKKPKRDIPIIIYMAVFILCTILMIALPNLLHEKATMDLANGNINSLWGSSLAVINGIVWLYSLAHMLEKIKLSWIRVPFEIIGKKTYGVMLFHFLFFRIISAILYITDLIRMEACRSLTPYQGLYWPLYFIGSVLGSLLLWKAMSYVPCLSSLFGQKKGIVTVLDKLSVFQEAKKISHAIKESVAQELSTQGKSFKRKSLIEFLIVIVLILIVILITTVSNQAILTPQTNLTVVEPITGNISISFPNQNETIQFGTGWLPQTEDEEYRWVQKESIFYAPLINQTSITMNGYIPEDVGDISTCTLYLNGIKIYEISVSNDQAITIQTDLSNNVISGKMNEFKLTFDAEKNPTITDVDQRSFSAMFTNIIIE